MGNDRYLVATRTFDNEIKAGTKLYVILPVCSFSINLQLIQPPPHSKLFEWSRLAVCRPILTAYIAYTADLEWSVATNKETLNIPKLILNSLREC